MLLWRLPTPRPLPVRSSDSLGAHSAGGLRAQPAQVSAALPLFHTATACCLLVERMPPSTCSCPGPCPAHLPLAIAAPCSNRFVDVLEESIHEWVRQQAAHTRPVSIGGEGGPHAGGASDFEDDHSSEQQAARFSRRAV